MDRAAAGCSVGHKSENHQTNSYFRSELGLPGALDQVRSCDGLLMLYELGTIQFLQSEAIQ